MTGLYGFQAGDLVWYRQKIRGGYGFDRDVPAVYVSTTARRVTVRVLLDNGTGRTIAVHPRNVRPREAQS